MHVVSNEKADICKIYIFFLGGVATADEPPAKLLDDLFCKTKATPCIYWLPLTDEQVRLEHLCAASTVLGVKRSI